MAMKNLLVVAGQFPPSTVIGAQRPLRLVRRIRKFGWEPHVLTIADRCMHPLDFNIAQDVLSSTHIEKVPCWSIWQHSILWRLKSKPGISRFLSRVCRAILERTEFLLPTDERYPWVIAATRRGVSMVERHNIDLIWSTTPMLSNLCLARRVSRRTNVPYIADFRDVTLLGNERDMSIREKRRVKIERQVLRDAVGVTYVAPSQINVLCEKHPFVKDMPKALLYNWFEESEIKACQPSQFDCSTILHGGSLYGGVRRLDGFLNGLSRVIKHTSAGGKRLQFLQFGYEDDAELLRREARKLDIAGAVKLEAVIPRKMFLSACCGSDILLLASAPDTGIVPWFGAIPIKLYDYFAACRPILVVGPPGCEAGKMVTRLNRGIAVPDDAPELIAEAIERLLRETGDSGKLDLSLEAVKEFEASEIVKKMSGFFHRVLS